MDEGTSAKATLLGQIVPLKLGFVGIKNRSQKDIIDKTNVKIALQRERDYFNKHPIYKTMPPGYLGTEILIQKLTKIFFRQIKDYLPDLIKMIATKTKETEEELNHLGMPIPLDNIGKINLLWNMLSEYCDTYKNILKGKYDSKRYDYIKDEGGYKIKGFFKELLNEFTGNYNPTKDYQDNDISYALTIHEGDSIPGFPSVDAFYYLLKPELEKLKDPIYECLHNTFGYLEELSSKILSRTFERFPVVVDDVNEFVNEFLNSQRDKATYIVESIVEMEINYLFTNDYDYLHNYTTFIPKQNENSKEKVDSKNIFIKEIRNRIEAYFKLIVRNLRDSIPKSIGYFLVKSIQDNMQLHLYNQLYKSNEMINVLNEVNFIFK